MNDPVLKFVKSKLEENEGIAPDALARLLAARRNSSLFTSRSSLASALLAASLAIACGWFFLDPSADARREADLSNVIELLRVADGDETSEAASLADTLLAYQDAPATLSLTE